MNGLIRVSSVIVFLVFISPIADAGKMWLDEVEAKTQNGTRDMRVIVRMTPHNNWQAEKKLPQKVSLAGKFGNEDSVDITIGQLSQLDPRVANLMQRLQGSKRSISIGDKVVAVSQFDENLIALKVSKTELLGLLDDPQLAVYEDALLKPSLSSSVPVVFSNQASAGFNGNGRAVALLDFGVSSSHSFLTGRLRQNVSACFSNRGVSSAGQSNPLTESLCVNEAASSVGGSSGDNCSTSIFGCGHGTMMAGIIAGSNASMSGVATGAQIISVQVGTRINDETVCGDPSITPCVGAFSFDIQEALNYVASIASAQRVAAVNISLGTEAALQGRCDDDPLKPAVDNLVAARVAVVASSGNSSSVNGMSSPACISNVIAVAATTNGDVPLSINNRSSELDFFAPGSAINTSSLPASTFASVTGTSAAAAHVSGAWAVLTQGVPSASVAQIQNALSATGVLVSQGLFSRRRIRIGNALNNLGVNPAPDPVAPAETTIAPIINLLLEDQE